MNFRRTFSNSNSRWYCLTIAFFGRVRISISAIFVQIVQHAHHRQAADEFGNQAELDQVFRLDLGQQFGSCACWTR